MKIKEAKGDTEFLRLLREQGILGAEPWGVGDSGNWVLGSRGFWELGFAKQLSRASGW